MMINKIHIRFFQIKYNLLVTALLFLAIYITQALYIKPLYVDNLNFLGNTNQSFLYRPTGSKKGEGVIDRNLYDSTCASWRL